jgi:hypothetical protein
MLKNKQIPVKEMNVIEITLEHVGDTLPMHTHQEGNIHITVLLKGKLKIHGPHFETFLSEGDVYDFKENEYTHELIALEDNTVFLNITKKYSPIEEPTEEELKYMEEQRRLSEIKNQEFRQMQMDMIKRIEEEDRAKGII